MNESLGLQGPVPRIALPGLRNLRDLGGHQTSEGCVLRQRKLFRAEALVTGLGSKANAYWDEANRDAYASLEIASIVDLRSKAERASAPSEWHRASGAVTHSFPINEGVAGTESHMLGKVLSGVLTSFSGEDLGGLYVLMLENSAAMLGSALRVIARGDTPVLVHCSAGKDRTGLVIALVLDLLGVDREAIIADYQITSANVPSRAEEYRARFEKVGVSVDEVTAMFVTPREALEVTFDYLDREYGSVARYLVERAGLELAELAALLDVLLEEGC